MGLSGLKVSYMPLVLWPPFEVHSPSQTFRSTILCCSIVIEDIRGWIRKEAMRWVFFNENCKKKFQELYFSCGISVANQGKSALPHPVQALKIWL